MPRARLDPARQQRVTAQMVAAGGAQAAAAVEGQTAALSAELDELQQVTDGLDVGTIRNTLDDYGHRLRELEGPIP